MWWLILILMVLPGYGQAFTRAISGDWGRKVFEEMMKVTDKLATLEYVDSTRMGAMGWSYGGYMMNWLQGHTKRFKCLAYHDGRI